MSGGFGDLGLMPEILRAVDEMGWILPRDVQDETIPLMLGGGDVMVAAETGSGKTGAFGIPVLQLVHEMRRAAAAGRRSAVPTVASTTSVPSVAKLNVDDRTEFVAVSPDGLMCQARDPVQWGGIRCTTGLSGGKYYFECSMRDEGLCRVGWSTTKASLDLGTDPNGYGFGGTGKKSNNRRFDTYGEVFGNGDIIGCALDMVGKTVSFSKNGKALGTAFELPAAQAPLFPAFCMKNGELSVNFGALPFQHAPAGFTGVFNALPAHIVRKEPTVAAPVAASAGDGTSAPLALILEPTRELALQTAEVIRSLMQYIAEPELRMVLLMGGLDPREALAELKRGCDIVVITPGLLQDFAKSGKINLSAIRIFVIDEADRMTDPENLGIVMEAFNKIPKGPAAGDNRLQVCLFSATLHSPEIAKLSDRICQHPTWVDLKGKDAVPETVFHLVIPVDATADQSWVGKAGVPTDGVHAADRVRGVRGSATLSDVELSQGTKVLKPAMMVALVDTLKMDQCLVFCRTNVDCDNLEKYLTALGGGRGFSGKMEKGKENKYSCCVLAGFRSMQERLTSLQAFHDGDVRFLICTDLAARGLDIKGLPFVVNMTLPDESENYIHRIGRVGRADRLGLALSFVSVNREKVWYHKCANRGKGCSNSKLVDQGGCTIWYNEPSLQGAIEQRLGNTIETMAAHATVDGGYAYELPSWAQGLTFGEDKVAPEITSEHISAIAPSVATLSDLEKQSQLMFLSLKTRFHKPASRK